METTPGTDYPALDGDRIVETLVIGAGLVGLLTAYRLVRSGHEVMVIEAGRMVSRATGYTTGKITSLHGSKYSRLLEVHGVEGMPDYHEANEKAIDEYESLVDREGIDCDFKRTGAYTYTEEKDGYEALEKEIEATGSS